MKKVLFLSVVLFAACSLSASAYTPEVKESEPVAVDQQYWTNNPDFIRKGMKYRQLKDLYDYRDYAPESGDRYETLGCLWNLLIPGLGQITMGETGRGLAWLAGIYGVSVVGSAVGTTMIVGSVQVDSYNDPVSVNSGLAAGGYAVVIVSALASTALEVASILDAVKVAKVKNLYLRDLDAMYGVDVKMQPYVVAMKTPAGLQPAAGLTLAVRF